jgi:hypothetical protein
VDPLDTNPDQQNPHVLALLNQDPLVIGMDPNLDPEPDPDTDKDP